MKTLCYLLVLSCLSLPALAQSTPDASPLAHPGWNFGAKVAGGSSITVDPQVGIVEASATVGRVLSHTRGRRAMRGTFEWGAEITPMYMFRENDRNTYGWGFSPVILRWNFTAHRRVVPFVEAAGGVIFTPRDFPAGNTSTANFCEGLGLGAHLFARKKSALKLGLRAVHISNASLGDHNPGVNAALLFQLGYTWFK
jgi:lipid A 3-O-deacylase